jgi:hypothetical protein
VAAALATEHLEESAANMGFVLGHKELGEADRKARLSAQPFCPILLPIHVLCLEAIFGKFERTRIPAKWAFTQTGALSRTHKIVPYRTLSPSSKIFG